MMSVRLIPLTLLALAAGAQAAEQAAAPAASASASAGSMLQVLFGLVAVLGLLAAGAWTLRRFNGSRTATGAAVKIIGGVSVGNRERILVVEVADQWIVVGVAPGRINTLSTMPRQESAALPEAPLPGKNFSAWLKQTIDKRNGE
jgi:flagellar protein FliO/FliZ